MAMIVVFNGKNGPEQITKTRQEVYTYNDNRWKDFWNDRNRGGISIKCNGEVARKSSLKALTKGVVTTETLGLLKYLTTLGEK